MKEGGGHTGQLSLHQLKRPDLLVELFPRMGIFESEVKGSLHDPTSQLLDPFPTPKRKRGRGTYPNGPPLRTSLSRSSPDINTAAPPPTLPNTFSDHQPISSSSSDHLTIGNLDIIEEQLRSWRSSHLPSVPSRLQGVDSHRIYPNAPRLRTLYSISPL